MDPETFSLVREEWPSGYTIVPEPGRFLRFDVVLRYETFEYLPRTAANLALTDAWFAGGIEWNLGSTGHSATTSRPVFAGSVRSSRGAALRIWEWERTRDLAFSVDLLMPADRPLLLAFVRVRNPDPEAKPLYWWANIAAPAANAAYARAIALSEGNAALAQVRQQYLQDLESYYKYRHNNSTEGMQQLIDKYKVAPKP